MDQIIKLLSSLFDLTKVASVTLPGLAMAGALTLLLLPPHPIDMVKVPIGSFELDSKVPEEQTPCSASENLEARPSAKPCVASKIKRKLEPACTLQPLQLNLFDEESNFEQAVRAGLPLARSSDQEEFEAIVGLCLSMTASPPDTSTVSDTVKEAVEKLCRLADAGKQSQSDLDQGLSSAVTNVCGTPKRAEKTGAPALNLAIRRLCFQLSHGWDGRTRSAIASLFTGEDEQYIEGSERGQRQIQLSVEKVNALATGSNSHPWEPKIVKQFILEDVRDRLAICKELESSQQGIEEADNSQLTEDIAHLDKQRSDLQDTYIASLRSNDRVLSENFRTKLNGIMELSDEYRERYRVNLVSVKERGRRLDEYKAEQDSITQRLDEPGRLRPIKDFDLFTQSLVNHVVGIILLSIALSLVLLAFDRTVLGNLFESLFPGW